MQILTPELNEMIKIVADNLEQEHFPPFTQEMLNTLEIEPTNAYDLLQHIMVSYVHKAIQPDSYYQACMILLTESLQMLRYLVERKRQWAIKLVAQIQDSIAEQVYQPGVDPQLQHDMLSTLQQAGLTVSQSIKHANEALFSATEVATNASSGQFQTNESFNIFERLAADDPFELIRVLIEQGQVVPDDVIVTLSQEMAHADQAIVRETATLMLLHPNPQIRQHIPTILTQYATKKLISPISLRRMIGIRNWLPQQDRPALDKLIRIVRRKGIECANLPNAEITNIKASEFDGAGVQAMMITAKQNRQFHLCGLLAKENVGIYDPWCLSNTSKQEISEVLKHMAMEVSQENVNVQYLNKLVNHFLWVGLENKSVPPIELLSIAETLGVTQWRAEPLDFAKELALLDEEIDASLYQEKAIAKSLQRSKRWLANKAFASSWFEDDAELDEFLETYPCNPQNQFSYSDIESLANDIVQYILEPRREKWAQRFFWLTLWTKEGSKKNARYWHDFFILSKLLYDDFPLIKIPLMTAIARESLYAAMQREN